MSTKAQILKEYLAFRSLRNHTKGGIQDIKFHINKFLNHSRKPLDDFDEAMLTKYVTDINKKYKINMANTVKSSYLKNFIKWYFEDWSSRFRNLVTICKTEKAGATYKPDDMLSEDDVKKLIKEEESNFWKAYFLTLFYGGCRPVEVVNLKWEDVEFEDDGVYFTIHSKKNKEDFLKFVPTPADFYLKKLKDNGSEYIFCNPRTKKPISVKGAYWKLRQMSEKTLGRKVNLYILRHSIATINYAKSGKNGINERDVALQMGHNKSMRSTYEHKDKKTLKANAKRIYFNADDIPEDKKHKLELEIEELKKKIISKDEIKAIIQQALRKSFKETAK